MMAIMAIEPRKGGSVADCEETFDWDRAASGASCNTKRRMAFAQL